MLKILNLDQVHLASWTLLGTRMEHFVGKVWWNKCGKFAVECLVGNLVFEIFSRRILVGKVEEEKFR